MEGEAEPGPGANTQPWDQTISTTDQVKEKAINEGSDSPSPSELSTEPAPPQKPQWQPPTDEEEKKRGKGKTALLMLALCVCGTLATLECLLTLGSDGCFFSCS